MAFMDESRIGTYENSKRSSRKPPQLNCSYEMPFAGVRHSPRLFARFADRHVCVRGCSAASGWSPWRARGQGFKSLTAHP